MTRRLSGMKAAQMCALTVLVGCGAGGGDGGDAGGTGSIFGALTGTWDVTFSGAGTAVAVVGSAGASSATFDFAESTSNMMSGSGPCVIGSSQRLTFEFARDLASGTMTITSTLTSRGSGCVELGYEVGTRTEPPVVYQLRHPSRGSTAFGMGGGQWEVVDSRNQVVLNVRLNQNGFAATTVDSNPYSAMGTLNASIFLGTDSASGTFTARRR